MKTYLYLVVAVAISAISLFIGFGIGNSDTHAYPQQTSRVDFSIVGSQNSSAITYENQTYGLRLNFPSTLAYAGSSHANGAAFGAKFLSPNINTSETKNRNTPNGFNTGAYDELRLDVYENTSGLSGSQSTVLGSWLRSIGSREPLTSQSLRIGSGTWVVTQESDGIESVGEYYYYITPVFVYRFGTDDFPSDAVRSYLEGFSVL